MNLVRVVLLWHMHQPSYRDPFSGTFILPWVRLHALKDYLGMVEILEETPEVHLTFNLVPSLLDQLESYATGQAVEILHTLSLKPAEELTESERILALKSFFMAHPQNLIAPYPRFAELFALRGSKNDDLSLKDAAHHFGVQDFRDLQLLSKLAWFDRDWQAKDSVLQALIQKGRDYCEEDKAVLADKERTLIAAVIPAYERAAQRGQIELSTSPYYHPILPLLCDTNSHHEQHPGAPLPRRYRHPEDAADQISRAVRRHQQIFKRSPAGMWPSEGSVSEEALLLIAASGLRWTASDESILSRSLNISFHRDNEGSPHPMDILYRPWVRQTIAGDIQMLFRDRVLSDLIGFTYSNLPPKQAAEDLLSRLRRIGESWKRAEYSGDPVVSVILDGENAWEYFQDGGRVFLRSFYQGLGRDPHLKAMTVSEALTGVETRELPPVSAGSWIQANFSVWIGHAEDRRAWTLLGETRDVLAQCEGKVPSEKLEKAWAFFRIACGSDWCWWYGEENVSPQSLDFDFLFRNHLRSVYEALSLKYPPALDESIMSSPKLNSSGCQPVRLIHPTVDGLFSSPDEWNFSGFYQVSPTGLSMRRGSSHLKAVRFGNNENFLFLLLETETPIDRILETSEIILNFKGSPLPRYRLRRALSSREVVIRREEPGKEGMASLQTHAKAVAADILEIGIPLEELRPIHGHLELLVLISEGTHEVERHPEAGHLDIQLREKAHD